MRRCAVALLLMLPGLPFAAYAETLTPGAVRLRLENIRAPDDGVSLPDDHPDYPVLVLLQALAADARHQPKAVISKLEELQRHTHFKGLSSKTSETRAELLVGTVGSYDLWRELMYLVLGRAYYESGDYERATHYYGGVRPRSPFHAMAALEKGWALLKLKNHPAAEKHIHSITLRADAGAGTAQWRALAADELALQKAFLSFRMGALDEAIDSADALAFQPGSRLEALRRKILAQAMFDRYLGQAAQSSFEQNTNALTLVSRHLESVAHEQRDQALALLAGETYWHLSSLYRVTDPVKYQARALDALKRGNAWLSPWIDKTLESRTAQISEEGYFLSVAILWELARFNEAIGRLEMLSKIFPQGKYLEDAFQLLGDYHYDKAKFDAALRHYSVLAKIGGEEKGSYGVYKAAWSFYNMNEKWKALRHLERLVLHHRKTGDDSATLLKEAQKDMLLVAAELLPFHKSLAELEIFSFEPQRLLKLQEDLGGVYKNIGRYDDAIGVWKTLLDRNPGQSPNRINSYVWLHELIHTQLVVGKRDQIAPSLDHYLPKLLRDGSKESRDAQDLLEKRTSTLLLTIHKEARKTDDPAIWGATDSFYASYATHYPGSRHADIWYHGAQRHEMLGALWKAASWYAKASGVEAYENRDDAALSVLKILQRVADSRSIGKAVSEDDYKNIIKYAQWYIAEFSGTPQRPVAETLLLEAHLERGDHASAAEYLIRVVTKEGATKEHQEQFALHTSRLYKAKSWEAAHSLADQLLNSGVDLGKRGDFKKTLLGIRQESAFQAAFARDKASDLAAARDWYGRALDAAADDEVNLKAWHNRLMTYRIESESELFIKDVRLFFGSSQMIPGDPSHDQRALLFTIHRRTADVWGELGNPLEKARYLSSSAAYAPSPEASDSLRWDALVLFGSHKDRDSLAEEHRRLEKSGSILLQKHENNATLARLYLRNKDFKRALGIIMPLVRGKEATPSDWLLVRDLYFRSIGDGPMHAEAADYLRSNQKSLRENAVLADVWRDLNEKEVNEFLTAASSLKSRRNLASIGRKAEAGAPQAHSSLKERVDQVAATFADLANQKESLKTYFQSSVPQISAEVLCLAAKLGGDSADHLASLGTPVIDSPQWPDFLKRLSEKIEELRTLEKKETAACEAQREQAMFLTPLAADAQKPSFYRESEADADRIVSLEASWRGKSVTAREKAYLYLKLGAYAAAEALAYGMTDIHERSLLLGLIRYAEGDFWNAAPLLRKAKEHQATRDHAKALLSLMAHERGNRRVASSEVEGLGVEGLGAWAELVPSLD